jgi:hypothetical protein
LAAPGGLSVPQTLEEFIHHQNMANYKRQFAVALDDEMRARLEALIEHEKASAAAQGWYPSYD